MSDERKKKTKPSYDAPAARTVVRLLEALWREALHLVNEGVATTGEIDDAIRFGAGIRWSFMGTFLTYTLAGGDAAEILRRLYTME